MVSQTRLVFFWIRRHWIVLGPLVVLQYILGEYYKRIASFLNIEASSLFSLHPFNGTVIFLIALSLALAKAVLFFKGLQRSVISSNHYISLAIQLHYLVLFP